MLKFSGGCSISSNSSSSVIPAGIPVVEVNPGAAADTVRPDEDAGVVRFGIVLLAGDSPVTVCPAAPSKFPRAAAADAEVRLLLLRLRTEFWWGTTGLTGSEQLVHPSLLCVLALAGAGTGTAGDWLQAVCGVAEVISAAQDRPAAAAASGGGGRGGMASTGNCE